MAKKKLVEGTKYDQGKALWDAADFEFIKLLGKSFVKYEKQKLRGSVLNNIRLAVQHDTTAYFRKQLLADSTADTYMLSKLHEGDYTTEDTLGFVPNELLDGYVDIITRGANKYAKDNWKSVAGGEERFLGAGLRHFREIANGEIEDKEWGTKHKFHAACSFAFSGYHAQKTEDLVRALFQKLTKEKPQKKAKKK